MDSLKPGSLWQHKKHNPEDGKYHQYRLMVNTTPAKNELEGGVSDRHKKVFPALHSETQQMLWIYCQKDEAWAYNPKSRTWMTEPMVVYRNLLADELPWARPKGEFVDGRFVSIQPNQIDEPTIAVEILTNL